jgi:hypothetical protein
VIAVILAEKWGVTPAKILKMDLGDVLRWWTIVSDLSKTKER